MEDGQPRPAKQQKPLAKSDNGKDHRSKHRLLRDSNLKIGHASFAVKSTSDNGQLFVDARVVAGAAQKMQDARYIWEGDLCVCCIPI